MALCMTVAYCQNTNNREEIIPKLDIVMSLVYELTSRKQVCDKDYINLVLSIAQLCFEHGQLNKVRIAISRAKCAACNPRYPTREQVNLLQKIEAHERNFGLVKDAAWTEAESRELSAGNHRLAKKKSPPRRSPPQIFGAPPMFSGSCRI